MQFRVKIVGKLEAKQRSILCTLSEVKKLVKGARALGAEQAHWPKRGLETKAFVLTVEAI